MSLVDNYNTQQKEALKVFVQNVYKAKVLNDIYKMLFTQGVFARFLSAADFNQKKAFDKLVDYTKWRHRMQVDLLLEHDFLGKEDIIREFMPCGFHDTDKQGRPILIVNAGQIKMTELLSCTNPENITKWIIKELEHTWREKFERCESVYKPQKVDQIRMIIDLKGATLKQITNKHLNLLWKEISKELCKRFPEFVHSIMIVNTPMFFESFFLSEIKPQMTEKTASKIQITGQSNPAFLQEIIDEDKLPAIYGGKCQCKSQCVYSDKGPWSVVLNVVDFQNKQLTTTEVEFQENVAAREEFKFQDDSDEDVDLLGEMSDLAKLKAAFTKHLPAGSQNNPNQMLKQNKGKDMDNGGLTAHPTLNDESLQSQEDTGTGGSSAERDRAKAIFEISNMLNSKLGVFAQDQTPMNTQDAGDYDLDDREI